MGNKVPYTRIPGLDAEQQRRIDENFRVAAAQLDAGVGAVKVPYRDYPGLDQEARRRINRNFDDLFCSGGGSPVPDNTVPPGTVLTSDDFSAATGGGVDLASTSTDIFNGGTSYAWDAGFTTGSIVNLTAFSGFGIGDGNVVEAQTSGPGSCADILDTGQYNYTVAAKGRATNIGSVGGFGCIARWEDSSNYVYGYYNGNGTNYTGSYGRVKAGVDTSYGTFTATTSDAIVELTVQGANIIFIARQWTGTVYLGVDFINDTDVPTGSACGLWAGTISSSPIALVDTFQVDSV